MRRRQYGSKTGNSRQNKLAFLLAFLISFLVVAMNLARADDIPPCEDYTEPDTWFDIADFGQVITSYDEVFDPLEVVECNTSVNGNIVQFTCGEWSATLTWKRIQQTIPFVNDETVFAYAEIFDYDAATGDLCIFNDDMNFVLGHSTLRANMCQSVMGGETDLQSDNYYCDYLAEGVVPPGGDPAPYDEAYGGSFGGLFNSSAFDLLGPASWTTTTNGLYDIYNNINYWGDYDEEIVSKRLIQIVPGTNLPNDDDDIDDDDAADDDDMSDDDTGDTDDDSGDDDDTIPDAADDDDDDDDGGICG